MAFEAVADVTTREVGRWFGGDLTTPRDAMNSVRALSYPGLISRRVSHVSYIVQEL